MNLNRIVGWAMCTIMLLASGCATLTGFQDARAVGKDNIDLMISANLSQSPDFNKWKDQDSTGLGSIIPDLALPSLELGGRYGITEKVDLSIRLNTLLNLNIGAKYQFLGDRESPVALAAGLELGTIGFVTSFWNVQVPLFLSVHPAPNFSWYLSPRYIYQFSAYTGAGVGLSYLGGNTGIFIGDVHKFGVDFGYYSVGNHKVNAYTPLFQIGLGARFSIISN